MKNPSEIKVIVGMSGGVDSSVTALLLKQQGYKVHGIFMKNWEADDNDPYCHAQQDLTDARSVCEKINIPFSTVNFSQQYWDNVFQHFLDEYAAGRTPNPDILCNKEIKFKAFLDYALSEGAHYIATGHYARCQFSDNHYQLMKGLDSNKDQSYFLCGLNQAQLQHVLFPIGALEKKTVREMAAAAGLINHNKRDSTGICFIGERRFKDFLKEYLLAQPGNIETEDGTVLGRHDGLMYYTIGQRNGIGLGGQKNHPEQPWFVLDKDINRKALIVGQGVDHPKLFKSELICTKPHWIHTEPLFPLTCTAKIRYRQSDQECVVNQLDGDNLRITFKDPQRAVTPGQAIVFYQGLQCLGGAIIS